MFGLWGKKKPKYALDPDEVYVKRTFADAALIEAALGCAQPVIITSFFPASLRRLESMLQAQGSACRNLDSSTWSGTAPPHAAAVGAGDQGTAPWLLQATGLTHAHGFDAWLSRTEHELLFLFVEHYPLLGTEVAVLDLLDELSQRQRHRVRFFVGLDEPLMLYFNGERVVDLFHKLAIDPKEKLAHPMISKAVRNAQKKLEKRLPHATPADSDEQWFLRNTPAR